MREVDNKIKVLIAVAGVGAVLFLPIWKVGKERGISAIGALARHTVSYKPTSQIDEVMVEETYSDLFKRAGLVGEKHAY